MIHRKYTKYLVILQQSIKDSHVVSTVPQAIAPKAADLEICPLMPFDWLGTLLVPLIDLASSTASAVTFVVVGRFFFSLW